MTVVPIRWIPWLALAAGFFTLGEGDAATGTVLVVIGLIGLAIKHLVKNSDNTSSADQNG